MNDNAWPTTLDGGGTNTSFVQENGSINLLPGVADSPEIDQQADNDYYFAGVYTNTIPSVVASYGDYTPIGDVAVNEEAAERAFAAADNDLRYHFNLPTTLKTNDLLTVSYDALNLDDPSAVNTDRRYGIEVYFNGVLVQTEIVIRPAQLNITYHTPTFSLADVNAKTGPGWDNIVSLKGINYNADGGGNWMGIDYVQLDSVPPATLTITNQPQSVTTAAATTATFTVGATTSATFPLTYQWKKGGVDIAGAMGASYTTPVLTLADNGSQFACTVGVLGATPVTSQTATLTVTPDITPPALLGAKGSPGLTEVVLTFSERVSAASATNGASYQISSASGSLSVTAAALSADSTKVTLTTAQQTVGTKYTITVNAVGDLAAPPNLIAPNSKAAFFPAGNIVQDANGFVVFEAENYDRNLDNLWVRDTARGTPSGGASMTVNGGDEFATQLEYDVTFNAPGTYKVWYRASANDGTSDSGWFHLDGIIPVERDPNATGAAANSDSMTGFSGALDFIWLSDSQGGPDPFTFDLASAGSHIIGLGRRENNAFFDKFIFTTNLTYTPTGFGPPETRAGQPPPPTVSITSPTNGQTFATGASVTVTANAAGSTNIIAIARVEYSANGSKIGEATSSPFTFTWNNVPQGNYQLRANAIDEVGASTVSATVRIRVGNPPPEALLVVANGPAPNASDNAAASRLQSLGFTVVVQGALASTTADADGRAIVVTSSTVPSGDVGNKFQTAAVPVVSWENALQDNYLFTLDSATDHATTTGQTDIIITDATHPLAAGLTAGTHTVVTTAGEEFSWGLPAPSAKIVATLADGSGNATIYAYEKGALLIDGVTPAPARRVHFLMTDNTLLALNADGLKLFDAAVKWAANLVQRPVIAAPTITGSNISFTWTGGGTLQETTDLGASWGPVAGNPQVSYSVQTTGTRKFYRVIVP